MDREYRTDAARPCAVTFRGIVPELSCPDDSEVAAFVEHTLAAAEREAFELHVHGCASCREALGHVIATGPDELIGRFALLEVLGVGGMGVVYAAHDPELDRDIAIKVLHAGTTGDARQRLLREAQALAKIDHANVIKVHDVGDHDGQVYIAMELADAGTLRTWLATKRSVKEIVETFVLAGRGLAAAHAAGLVHRDFKPDNVLVFRGGRVCVTDFGLVGTARADSNLETTAPARPSVIAVSPRVPEDLTRTGSVMGTPLYMSSEQFTGGAATAASDQFSFCVALYEALYGTHPFGGTSYAELAVNVTAGQIVPEPEGVRVPSWLRRAVRRGLADSPADRFPTMKTLIDELGRDRGKHRTRLATVGVITGLAAFGIIAALRPAQPIACTSGEDQLARVWNPGRRAELQAAFFGSHRPHAPETFSKTAAIIDHWSAAWAVGHRDACEATRTHGNQSEHALDLRMACLDDRLADLGAAVDVLGAGDGVAVDHALDAMMRLPSVAPCTHPSELAALPEGVAATVSVHAVEATIDRARAELALGHYAVARASMSAALPFARATTYPPLISDAQRVLGEAQLELADPHAIESFRGAIHVARASRDTTAEVDASAGLVVALTKLAGKYEVASEIAELADAAAASIRPGAELLGKVDLARGDLELARGKPALAHTRYEQALARDEKELGPDHVAVLAALERLGNVLKVQGKFDDARARYERVLAARQRLEAPDHPDVASALDNLGSVARAESKLDVVLGLYNRALAIRTKSLGPDHPAVADSYNNYGAFYAEQGDPVKARSYFDRALALYERVYGAESVEVAESLSNFGSSLVVSHDYKGAVPVLEHALAIYEARLGPNERHVAYVMSELGVIAERTGKLDDALVRIRRAEQIATAVQGADHPDIADYLEREGSVLTSMNRVAEAEPVLVRAIQIYRNAYGGEHPRVAMGLGALAQLQGARNDYKGALASWQQALPIFEATLPGNHPNLSFALAGIGDALTELGRTPEAMSYLERALAIREHAKMAPAQIAEIHFYLAAALVTAPGTRARAIIEARAALAMYQQAGDDDDVRELQTWLAKHR